MLDETVLQIEKVNTTPYKTFHPHPTPDAKLIRGLFHIHGTMIPTGAYKPSGPEGMYIYSY